MRHLADTSQSASVDFAAATSLPQKTARKRPSPVSVRLSPEERAELERVAEGRSLNSYIKARIFGAEGKARRDRRALPVRDHAALAQALGLLGAMELAGSLRELSHAAKTGALPVSPETEEELISACAAVLAIKAELMRALGYEDSEAP
ncbi:MAG: hypothetical protein NXH97_20965 [Rhodobacteraceae bacterium]|nr:hypothetical protein [Paracoccaceae bacterium]